MACPHSEKRYSPELCAAVRENLAGYPDDLLNWMLPELRRRGGQGLTLLRLELRRRKLPF